VIEATPRLPSPRGGNEAVRCSGAPSRAAGPGAPLDTLAAIETAPADADASGALPGA